MSDDTSPTPGQPSQPSPPGEPTPPTQPTPPTDRPAPTPPPAAGPPAASVPPAGSVPPPPGYGQPADPGSVPPPAKGKSVGQRVLRIAITIVVVIVVGIAWRSFQTSHATKSAPGKGSCVQAKDTTTDHASVDKVDCSDAKAEYVVLDKIVGGNDASCNAVSGTEASFVSSKAGDDSKALYVLCLKDK